MCTSHLTDLVRILQAVSVPVPITNLRQHRMSHHKLEGDSSPLLATQFLHPTAPPFFAAPCRQPQAPRKSRRGFDISHEIKKTRGILTICSGGHKCPDLYARKKLPNISDLSASKPPFSPASRHVNREKGIPPL